MGPSEGPTADVMSLKGFVIAMSAAVLIAALMYACGFPPGAP